MCTSAHSILCPYASKFSAFGDVDISFAWQPTQGANTLPALLVLAHVVGGNWASPFISAFGGADVLAPEVARLPRGASAGHCGRRP